MSHSSSTYTILPEILCLFEGEKIIWLKFCRYLNLILSIFDASGEDAAADPTGGGAGLIGVG